MPAALSYDDALHRLWRAWAEPLGDSTYRPSVKRSNGNGSWLERVRFHSLKLLAAYQSRSMTSSQQLSPLPRPTSARWCATLTPQRLVCSMALQ